MTYNDILMFDFGFVLKILLIQSMGVKHAVYKVKEKAEAVSYFIVTSVFYIVERNFCKINLIFAWSSQPGPTFTIIPYTPQPLYNSCPLGFLLFLFLFYAI